MNRVNLVGRLARDPEVRYSQGQNPTAVARFTLAVDRRFKRDGEANADFISCIESRLAAILSRTARRFTPQTLFWMKWSL